MELWLLSLVAHGLLVHPLLLTNFLGPPFGSQPASKYHKRWSEDMLTTSGCTRGRCTSQRGYTALSRNISYTLVPSLIQGLRVVQGPRVVQGLRVVLVFLYRYSMKIGLKRARSPGTSRGADQSRH
jgi:hypothetical protein